MESDEETFNSDEHSNIVPLNMAHKPRSLKDRVEKASNLSKRDKDIVFSKGIADGLDPETAYIKAFGSTRPTVARKRGQALILNVKMKGLIDVERSRRQSRGTEEGDRLRKFLVDRLEHEAIHARSDTARITALRLIGDLGHVQAFKPPLPGEKAEVPTDMAKRLEELIRRIGGESSSLPPPEI